MKLRGRVHKGVVVLEESADLPEGLPVTVLCEVPLKAQATKKQRVVLPLVPSKHPGNVRLTGERIAEILEEDDLSP